MDTTDKTLTSLSGYFFLENGHDLFTAGSFAKGSHFVLR